MKKITLILSATVLVLLACNSNTDTKSTATAPTKTENGTADYPYVTAKVNGVAWQSVPGEIMTSYDQYGDKLQIFTKDEKGKMNFLLTLAPFTKTAVGTYSSIKEGAGGYGISLLDEDKNDNVENDYDNFHQGAVANCLTITAIKEVADGKIVTGVFASPMNVTNNYDDSKKNKGVAVTEGKFAVLVKK
ncbi:MAG: hypothetical protein WDM90_15525 [Ferruginibacter sp.]